MVRFIAEADSPGGEGQGLSKPSKEIVQYPYRKSITPLYKASAAKNKSGKLFPTFLGPF